MLSTNAWLKAAFIFGLPLALIACGGGGTSTTGGNTSAASAPDAPASGTASSTTPSAPQHILFVGDSFTHGRYTPVRNYNAGGTQNAPAASPLVVDENFGQTGLRAESSEEAGPWGGIPGIFAELVAEAHLNYDVHIEAISETSLEKNFFAASSVIEQTKWNSVVLQELSAKPLPQTLTGSSTSDPAGFCSSVKTIEQGVHSVAPSAGVYLYEPWPTADLAQQLSGTPGTTEYHNRYINNLSVLGNANHNAYYSAASHDGAIVSVAPVGEAWQRAWAEGVANPDPKVSSALPLLWYNINAVNNPALKANNPDLHHPSIYGAYLSALVLFEQITGTDVRAFGRAEAAAQEFGIPAAIAVQLQGVAWETVAQESAIPLDESVDPCTLKQ